VQSEHLMFNLEKNHFQLIDFGGSVPLSSIVELNFTGAADHLAPELRQYHRHPYGRRPISCAVDVFSLGCVIGPLLLRPLWPRGVPELMMAAFPKRYADFLWRRDEYPRMVVIEQFDKLIALIRDGCSR
jgi:hypothetical protein